MVLIRALHNTTGRHLRHVLRTGLEPRVPSQHKWPTMLTQPKGIYISPVGNDKIWYCHGDENILPVLRVHYCGPMQPDNEMGGNCFICFRPIPPHMIELMTENPLS